MAQYLMSVWHDDDYEVEFTSETAQRLIPKVTAFNEELTASGAFVFAAGLNPASSAQVFRYADGDVAQAEGPYSDSPRQMGGFWIIESPDLDTALALGRKAAIACEGPVEVRPFQTEGPPQD